mgnify:CR=1 FL=1
MLIFIDLLCSLGMCFFVKFWIKSAKFGKNRKVTLGQELK